MFAVAVPGLGFKHPGIFATWYEIVAEPIANIFAEPVFGLTVITVVLLELQSPFGVAFDKFDVFPKQKFGKFPDPVIAAMVGTGITVMANGAEVAVQPFVPVTVTV